MKKIMFTGGGSAGHVTVNLALIPHFARLGWSMSYIGSHDGIEKQLIQELPDVRYYSVSTGKLRRYLDWQNIKDPFKVMRGIYEAYRIMKKEQPDIVFSKGGFVSVPVVIGARLNHVPVIIHESDITPGVANRIAAPFAKLICTTFPETVEVLGKEKARVVGPVIRESLKQGDAARGRMFTGLGKDKPVILIMGGSLGASSINQAVREALPELAKEFHLVHLCGKGQLDQGLADTPGYRQYEYISEELPDLLAMCDIVISRAGSNSIFEFLYFQKPMLLIPLTRQQSRGDQLLNAASFERSGYGRVLQEEDLNKESLMEHIRELFTSRASYIAYMNDFEQRDALTAVCDLIIGHAR